MYVSVYPPVFGTFLCHCVCVYIYMCVGVGVGVGGWVGVGIISSFFNYFVFNLLILYICWF